VPQNAASTNDNDNLVDIRGVSFKYNTRTILDNLTLSIPRGKVTAIMGGSGCGKTTHSISSAGASGPARGRCWWIA
jgi:phospholipid/cholesterol/gamma-HCH transport system ATP-binding protein